MWVVTGTTANGETVEYKVPAGKDTDKAFVLALAFQQHGSVNADDPLTAEAEVKWTSDNIMNLPNPIKLFSRGNFAVDRRVGKGVWERHSQRAFRSLEAACEVMESAASEYPGEKFRIVAAVTEANVVAVSKNAADAVSEVPDEPKAEEAPKAAPEAESAESAQEAPKPRTARTSKSKAA